MDIFSDYIYLVTINNAPQIEPDPPPKIVDNLILVRKSKLLNYSTPF